VKSFSFKRGVLIAYLFIALHIFLDLITSYGTQIFSPVTNARYAITCVFIIDPIYTLVMIAILYFSFKSLKTRKTIAIAGLIWIFLYPATNLGIRYTLGYHTEKRLRNEGIEFTRLDVSTDILSPFFWKVIVEQEDTYQIAGIQLLKPNAPFEFMSYRKAERGLFQELGKSAPVFSTYAWFFDFPIVKREASENGEETLTIWDLRFSSTLAFIRRAMQENGEQPFALKAVLNEENRLIRYYDHRGKETVLESLSY
jgi:inner membrane protein